jgi:ABC-type transport system involved in multi-copper enzyme maturation permease subunit
MMGTVNRCLALAENTFLDAIRNRIFLGLLVMAIAFLLFSTLLSDLAVRGEAERVVLDFGLFSMSFCGVLISIVMGVILLHKEVEKKTIYTLLSKPVSRIEVIVGKYLGMLSVLAVGMTLMVMIWVLLLASKGADVRIDHALAGFLLFFEVMIVAAIAMVFSAFSSPVLSGLFTFGIFGLGRLLYLIENMLDSSRGFFVNNPALRGPAEVFVWICPDLSVFNVSQDLLQGIPVTGAYVGSAFGYAMATVIFLLGFASVLFLRRDFT